MDLGIDFNADEFSSGRGGNSGPSDPLEALREDDRERVRSVTSNANRSPGNVVRDLLELGTRRLGVESGWITHVNPVLGTHTIVETSGSSAVISKGRTTELAATYCRRTIEASTASFVVHDAPNQGWEGDPAYETSGLCCYLGAKVFVGQRLYGTVCFGDTAARSTAFGEAEEAFVTVMGRLIGRVFNRAADEGGDSLSPASTDPSTASRSREGGGGDERQDAWLSSITENVEEGLYRATPEEGIVYANRSLAELFGYESVEEIRSLPPEQLYARPERYAELLQIAEQEDQDTREVQFQRKDGSTFTGRLSGSVIRDEQGNVRYIDGVVSDISESRRRQQALREERNLLNLVFQTSPTAITLLDAKGKFVRVSDRAQQILGLEQDDVTDRMFNDPAWRITAPDGGPFPEEDLPFARVKETGESVFGVEHAIEWPDGTWRLLSVSGAPLHDDEGDFFGAVFHLDDITERRKAIRNLQKSEQRFRGVFENAGLGIALLTENGEIQDANPALASMLETEPEALRGVHFEAITHPDDVEADRHLYDELTSGTRDQYQIEKRYVRPSGEAFWAQLTVSRRDGPEEMQIVGMVENIDVQKKQKEDLRLFRKMVEQAEDAIVLNASEPLDAPEIIYANPAFTEMTGFSHEELVGNTPRLIQGPFTDRDTLDQLKEHLAEGTAFAGETINYRKDGTPFVNRWNVAPVRDETDTITHWVSVQRDVTEQRRMQERLLEVQEEERRRIDQEIHDEMGGLLTSLQMTVELARLNAQDDCVSPAHLDEVESLVSELASTARTISRKLYPTALSEDGLIDALETIIEEMGTDASLTVDLRSGVDPGERFSSLVERTACWIVQEALVNVDRHAETDTAQVVLTTGDDQLRLQVIDEGVGFDPDQESGEGFGLEGIRRRVERLNGTLTLDTAPGDGTHLTVTLPLTIASVPR